MCRLVPHPRAWTIALTLLAAPAAVLPVAGADANARVHFNIPAADAAVALKQFAQQSQIELLYSTGDVANTTTKAVRGEFVPREALGRLLEGTGLVVTQGKTNGVLAVTRAADPNGARAALGMANDRPQTNPSNSSPTSPRSGSSFLVTGRVTNAATHANLEGALVQIDGTGLSARTERDGTYRLAAPEGEHTLVVSYTGLETQRVAVSAAGGSTVRRDVDLTSDIYQLGVFTVAGEREGNALAITMQRQAPNVKNVVSADAFGALAGNPADLLVRLPGVVGESVDGDFRYVQIRGMSRNLNTITMDGNRVADAGSANANREFQFQQVGSDAIERMEIVKSPTPDMDADSIGGAVNLVSKSAFDRAGGRHLGGSIGATWRATDERDKARPNLTLSYSEVVGGRLGVAVNYGVRSHLAASDKADQVPQDSIAEPHYIASLSLRDSRNVRTRLGAGLKLDFKLSEQSRFYFNGTLNRHDEHTNHNLLTTSTTATIATVDAAGNFTNNGGIIPGFTNEVTEWRPMTNTLFRVTSNSNKKIGETMHYQVGAVHRFGELELDYDAYHSRSKTRYPANAAFDLTARGIGLRIEQSGDPFFPQFRQTAGPSIFDPASYRENQLTLESMQGIDQYRGAAVNARRRFATAAPTWVKAGLRIREQTRELSNTSRRYTYLGLGGSAATADLRPFINPHLKYTLSGRYPQLPSLPYPTHAFRDNRGDSPDYSGYNIGTALNTTPALFREDIAYGITQNLGNAQDFKERIGSAYLMGNLELGKLSVLGGVRVEDTRTHGEGPLIQITSEERARRASFVGPVTDDELRRRALAEYSGRRTASGRYREVFPGVHLKYEAGNGVVARASYATNIGRPAIGQLIPRTTVDNEGRSVATSNPSLKPQFADNFDLGLEYYFEPVGLVSAGVFLKEISNFIYTLGGQTIGAGPDNGFNGDYQGYAFSSQANGGFARVRGFELAYQQQFTSLPGWWRGFGAFANYTRMETDGNYGTNVVRSTSEVAGFIPEAANVGISYIRRPVSIRVQFNYASRFLSSFNASQARLLYRRARPVVDIKTVYTINRHFDLYLDVTNVFAEGDRVFEYWGGRPNTMEWMRPQFFFGLNARL
jgi:TonB-dependent receptor